MESLFYVETENGTVTCRQLLIRAANHILNPPTCLKTAEPKSEKIMTKIEKPHVLGHWNICRSQAT